MNPIPTGDAENTGVDAGRTVGGDARRERLVAEGKEPVVLCFTGTRELLPEDAIAEGKWIFES